VASTECLHAEKNRLKCASYEPQNVKKSAPTSNLALFDGMIAMAAPVPPNMTKVITLIAVFTMLGAISSANAHEKSCVVLRVQNYFDGQIGHRGVQTLITIENDTVTSVTKAAHSAKSGCQFIDLTSLFLTPGLVDAHTHVLLTDQSYGVDFSSELLRQSSLKPETRAIAAKIALRSLLYSGFTSIRDLGNSGVYEDLELRSELERGHEPMPRMFCSGPGIAILKGQFPKNSPPGLVAREYEIVKTATEAKAAVLHHQSKRVDLIKVYADVDPQPEITSQEILNSVVESAHAKGLKVAAHATMNESAHRAAIAGVDSIEHGYLLSEDTLKLMADKKIFLVANDFDKRQCEMIGAHDKDPVYHPCSVYQKLRSQRLLSAKAHGIEIVFGSDMYLILDGDLVNRGPATIESLLAYSEEGLSPLEALKAATANAAHLLGQNDLGEIKTGARADIVGFEKSPLDSLNALRKVAFVMKAGKIVCGVRAATDKAGVSPCMK
jgi:imidazolonepropionase-like amidohydrolase